MTKVQEKRVHRIPVQGENGADAKVISKKINQLVHDAINKKENHVILEFDEDVRISTNIPDVLEPIVRSLVANQYRVQVLSENIDDNINVYYLNISWMMLEDNME